MRTLAYDRTVPNELVDAIAPGGDFHELVQFASGPYDPDTPLDLRLRALRKQPDVGHARLYLGTTQVGALHINSNGRFRFLNQTQSQGATKWADAPWANWQKLDDLAVLKPQILREVGTCVEVMTATGKDSNPRSYVGEGRLQTAIAKSASHVHLLDREVVFSFENSDERRAELALASAPSDATYRSIRGEPRAGGRLKRFGGEIDGLAVDHLGRLLVIEVKPGSASGPVAWTPAQVAVYLRLVRRWIKQTPKAAADALRRLVEQYIKIGMLSNVPPIPDDLVAVPVIALSGIDQDGADWKKLTKVRKALETAGEPLEDLQVWNIEERTGAISAFAL